MKAMGQDHVEEALHLHVHVSTWSCPMASTTFLYIQHTPPVNTRYQSKVGGRVGGEGGQGEGVPLRSNGGQ